MQITIAGYGPVGRAHAHLLSQEHEVQIYDPPLGHTEFGTPTHVIICVATPADANGRCQMRNVEAVLRKVAVHTHVLIKSTISLEGWHELTRKYPQHLISFSPEFLRARSAEQDLLDTELMFIGGRGADGWSQVFDCEIETADPRSLITAKYARNTFLALKVSYFNQLYDFCRAAVIQWSEARGYTVIDDRIGQSHSSVTDQRGYGGHCFPKDVSAFITTAQDLGADMTILEAADEYNRKIRREE